MKLNVDAENSDSIFDFPVRGNWVLLFLHHLRFRPEKNCTQISPETLNLIRFCLSTVLSRTVYFAAVPQTQNWNDHQQNGIPARGCLNWFC
jgi:hypothetical protein